MLRNREKESSAPNGGGGMEATEGGITETVV